MNPSEPTAAQADDGGLDTVEAALAERWPETKIAPDLSREQLLMDLLGEPQSSAPAVHIAGTNGKTSTTRMIESLLRSAGLSTGMYTSPHLQTVRERICLDGVPIDPERFATTYAELEPYLALVDNSAGRLTAFEVLTGMAFACFADAPVAAMAVECGMGGSWDATNVLQGAVNVITPIAMDHSAYLGTTLDLIAAEKAGIITSSAPVILGSQNPVAEEVLAAAAAQMGAPLFRYDTDFRLVGREQSGEGQILDIAGLAADYEEIRLPLLGPHQAENAAVALAAVESFLGGRALDIDLVREAFAGTSSPGRLDVLRTEPFVLADAAHNPHGMAALVAALLEADSVDRYIAVVAVLDDKEAHEMLEILSEVASRVVVTRNSSYRSFPAEDLAGIARDIWPEDDVDVVPSMVEALELAIGDASLGIASGGSTGVLITGSVATVADARRLISEEDDA